DNRNNKLDGEIDEMKRRKCAAEPGIQISLVAHCKNQPQPRHARQQPDLPLSHEPDRTQSTRHDEQTQVIRIGPELARLKKKSGWRFVTTKQRHEKIRPAGDWHGAFGVGLAGVTLRMSAQI